VQIVHGNFFCALGTSLYSTQQPELERHMAALRIKAAGTGGSEGSDHEQRVAGFEGSSARPAKAAGGDSFSHYRRDFPRLVFLKNRRDAANADDRRGRNRLGRGYSGEQRQ
jgi:hypothetical protein